MDTQHELEDEEVADAESIEAAEEYYSAIGVAIDLWSKGKHIPMTLYSELVENGYDVPRLEARHFI